MQKRHEEAQACPSFTNVSLNRLCFECRITICSEPSWFTTWTAAACGCCLHHRYYTLELHCFRYFYSRRHIRCTCIHVDNGPQVNFKQSCTILHHFSALSFDTCLFSPSDYSIILLIRGGNISGTSSYQSLVYSTFGFAGYLVLSVLQFLYPFIGMSITLCSLIYVTVEYVYIYVNVKQFRSFMVNIQLPCRHANEIQNYRDWKNVISMTGVICNYE